MNETPTSGPITRSSTHHALDATSSRHSFFRSHTKGELRERKKDLFQVSRVSTLGLTALAVCPPGPGRQLVERPFAADATAAQQHEPIADPCGVVDLVDRE